MIVDQDDLRDQRSEPVHERAQTLHQSREYSLFVEDRNDDAEFGTTLKVHEIRF